MTTSPKDAERVARIQRAIPRWFLLFLSLVFTLSGWSGTTEGWAVAHGQGVGGTFTVTQIGNCGKGCDSLGDFTPGGSATATARGIDPEGGFSFRHVADHVSAVLYDGAVYPPGGGGAWERGLVQFLLGLVGLLIWGLWMRRRALRRRAHPITPAPASGNAPDPVSVQGP